MNFKMFFENNDKGHEYSCTMALIEKPDLKLFRNFADKIDKNDLEDCGIEKESHCTILYGTHSDNVYNIKAILLDSGIEKIKIKLKGLSTFPETENGVVLKVDVESKDLKKLNKLLKELPNTNDFPTYRPHITIAYLKPGTEKKYLKLEDPFKNKELTTSEIMFSKSDGIKVVFKLNEL